MNNFDSSFATSYEIQFFSLNGGQPIFVSPQGLKNEGEWTTSEILKLFSGGKVSKPDYSRTTIRVYKPPKFTPFEVEGYFKIIRPSCIADVEWNYLMSHLYAYSPSGRSLTGTCT